MLSHFNQVLYDLCLYWPRYQVSVYRTIGPLVFHIYLFNTSNRISEAGYKLQRVPEDIGMYNAMEHGQDKQNNSIKYGS